MLLFKEFLKSHGCGRTLVVTRKDHAAASQTGIYNPHSATPD